MSGSDPKRAIYEWKNSAPVRGTQRAVLGALAEFADAKGETFRGQEAIAERCAFHEVTVRRALKALEGQGLINREKRYDKRGKRTSDTIRLCVHSLPSAPLGSKAVTTERSATHYRALCNSLPSAPLPESTEESTEESKASPLPPKGAGDAGKREGRISRLDGAFYVVWNNWPEEHRPPNRRATKNLYLSLSEADQRQALGWVGLYADKLMSQGERPCLVEYLKGRMFEHPSIPLVAPASASEAKPHEIEGDLEPEQDAEGYFIITPGCRQWGQWVEFTRTNHGEKGVRELLNRPIVQVVSKYRTPDELIEKKRQEREAAAGEAA